MSRLSEKRKAAVESMMKEAIYEAAVKILLHQGLDGLTMERVAEAAGMAKGTLYNYFQDKKSLQLYIFARVSEPFNQQLSAIRRSTVSPKEKLVKIMEVIFLGFEKNRQILVILSGGRIHNLKEYSMQLAAIPEFSDCKATKEPIGKVIESVVLEGIQAKQFFAFDPKLATDLVLGAITSVIDRQIQDNLPRATEENIAQLIRFLMEGLMKA
ncbi:MAG: TetR/AcrR family transcriptional regulator [Anaerolineales bacterium]|nr:TetR/AcrR family transcriptional regulator [Anaerolineales bacterium]